MGNVGGMDMLYPGEAVMRMETLLKDNHLMVLGNLDFLSYIEHSLYMNGNNDDFKLLSGNFAPGMKIVSIALVKKTKELREFLGVDDNKRWKHLLCICFDKVEGIFTRVDGVYSIPKWGITKSIRTMLNSIISTLEVTDEAEKMGVEFSWCNLPLLYCYEDDYKEYWFDNKKNKSKKRRRTHIPRGLRHEVFKRDGYKCVECGASKDDGATLHVDHKIPVSKGGTDELDNLQTLCSDCNLNKSDVIQ